MSRAWTAVSRGWTAVSRSTPRNTALLILLLAASGCRPPFPDEEDLSGAEGDAREAVDAALREAVANVVPEQAGTGTLGDPALASVATEPVQLRAGPGGEPFEVVLRTTEPGPSHTRQIGRGTFDIALRATRLSEYPCSSCHTPGRPVIDPERIPDAHQHIQPVHPAEANAACATCHITNDVERLRLIGPETASLNQAYRLCAQCHFEQVDAWAGGGHGKRLDVWLGPRVLMGCTDCHDPHQPAVPRRIPYPGPQLNRREPRLP